MGPGLPDRRALPHAGGRLRGVPRRDPGATEPLESSVQVRAIGVFASLEDAERFADTLE